MSTDFVFAVGVLTDLSRLDDGPLEALHVQAHGSQSREEDNSLQTNLLPLIVLGLRRPVQERDNILRHLRRCSGSA